MSKKARREGYTKHLHATRLVEMFKAVKDDEMAWHCPASLGFQPGKRFLFEVTFDIREDPLDAPECQVCKAFVDMPPDTEACPCDHLGYDEAIEITKQKLKEEGYLDE